VNAQLGQRARWVVGPLLLFSLSGLVGRSRSGSDRGEFFDAVAALPRAEREALEAAPALAVANASWAFGNEDSVKRMLRSELDRIGESNPVERARVLIRFGIFDTNPDGQAAVFSQACADDPTTCNDGLRPIAEREVAARAVPPGNQLPMFLGGHPTP
jgi:hypothetical protein